MQKLNYFHYFKDKMSRDTRKEKERGTKVTGGT